MKEEVKEEKYLVENKESKLSKISLLLMKIFSCFMAGVLFLFALASLFITGYFNNKYYEYSEKVLYKYDNIFLNIIGVTILLIVGYLIYKLFKKIKIKYLKIALVTFMLVVGALFIIYLKVPPKADQECIVYGAGEFLNGNFQWLEPAGYIGAHPLQIGITLFVELIFKICNSTNYIIVQLANVIFSAICTYLICNITRKMFNNENTNRIVIILLFGFFELIFLNTHVYGNIVGLMLSLFAILFTLKFIDDKKLYYIPLIAIPIALAIVLKSNYEVYLIGIVLVIIVNMLKKFNVKSIVCIFATLLTVIIFNKLTIFIMEKHSNVDVKDGIPMSAYIYMGIQENSQPGWYTGYVVNSYMENNCDTEITDEKSKELIKNRISDMLENPSDAVSFFASKIKSTWFEPTFQTIWVNKPSEVINDERKQYVEDRPLIESYYDGKISMALERYFDYYQIIVYLFTAVYLVTNLKSMNEKKLLLLIIMFGGVLFHLLWETKSIYALTYYILLLPYAAQCIYILYNKVEEKIDKKLNKKRNIKVEEV